MNEQEWYDNWMEWAEWKPTPGQNIYGETIRWHTDWPWRVHTPEEQYERLIGLYWGYVHIVPRSSWWDTATIQERQEYIAWIRNSPRRLAEYGPVKRVPRQRH